MVTASDRAAAGLYEDRSGAFAEAGLKEMGFEVERTVVHDGAPVAGAIANAVAADYEVVITTGGTGLSERDLTPEMTRPLLTRELPHLAAEIAQRGVQAGIPTAVLSRGIAGVAQRTVVVNLPGSLGGVRDGMAVLSEVLVHAVSQIRGSDDQVHA
ncbi:MogA/MoaB family molybdenum cofactor biosynthesis protein [Luteococcus peritonei]